MHSTFLSFTLGRILLITRAGCTWLFSNSSNRLLLHVPHEAIAYVMFGITVVK